MKQQQRNLQEAKDAVAALKIKYQNKPAYILRAAVDQFWFFGQLNDEAKAYVSEELNKLTEEAV